VLLLLLRQSLGCSCDRRHQSPGGWVSLAAASHLLCCKGAHLLKYTFSIERANEQWCVTPSAEPAYRSKPPSPSMAMMTRNPVICALTEQHDASSTLRYRSASSTKFLCARPRQQNSPLAHLRPPQHLQLRPPPLPKPISKEFSPTPLSEPPTKHLNVIVPLALSLISTLRSQA
jgi:hypothetical protein